MLRSDKILSPRSFSFVFFSFFFSKHRISSSAFSSLSLSGVFAMSRIADVYYIVQLNLQYTHNACTDVRGPVPPAVIARSKSYGRVAFPVACESALRIVVYIHALVIYTCSSTSVRFVAKCGDPTHRSGCVYRYTGSPWTQVIGVSKVRGRGFFRSTTTNTRRRRDAKQTHCTA